VLKKSVQFQSTAHTRGRKEISNHNGGNGKTPPQGVWAVSAKGKEFDAKREKGNSSIIIPGSEGIQPHLIRRRRSGSTICTPAEKRKKKEIGTRK